MVAAATVVTRSLCRCSCVGNCPPDDAAGVGASVPKEGAAAYVRVTCRVASAGVAVRGAGLGIAALVDNDATLLTELVEACAVSAHSDQLASHCMVPAANPVQRATLAPNCFLHGPRPLVHPEQAFAGSVAAAMGHRCGTRAPPQAGTRQRGGRRTVTVKLQHQCQPTSHQQFHAHCYTHACAHAHIHGRRRPVGMCCVRDLRLAFTCGRTDTI